MERKIKTFMGLVRYKGQQRRALVGARTKKEAMELTAISPRHFNEYWWENSNSIFSAIITEVGIWCDLDNDSSRACNFVKVRCWNGGNVKEILDPTVRILPKE